MKHGAGSAGIQIAFAIGVLACVGTAAAQDVEPERTDEEARTLFNEGTAAFEAGRFEEAAEKFRVAYELSGRPEMLYNLGFAYERIQEPERALSSFEQYLERSPGASNRASVEARVAALRAAIREREELEERAAQPPQIVAVTEPAPEPAPLAPAPAREPRDDGESSLVEAWWLWAIVGVVVAGTAALVIGLAADGGGLEGPVAGDHGVVIATLGGP